MKRAIFWGSGALLAYTYLGFPALVLLRARLRPRPHAEADVEPSVTVVVAAHNEEEVIEQKLRSLLDLDYPSERLDIIVASDGSTDRTADVVRGAGDGRVELLDLPRVGKAEALNRAVERAGGEVVVFSDANSLFDQRAVRELVRPFADPGVGGVAGNQVYRSSSDGDASTLGERRYWDLDRRLKIALSRAGSVTGSTGAIHAVRRRLVAKLRDDVNDDLFLSLRVVAQGHRLVFAPKAIAYEGVSPTVVDTFARRVRVMVRGLRCVAVQRDLLDPRRYGFFSLQLVSHKVLLRTAAFPLAFFAASSGLLARTGRFYRAAALAQVAFYGFGACGLVFARRPWSRAKVLALPAYFCLVNAASVVAVWHLVRRRRFERWDTASRNG